MPSGTLWVVATPIGNLEDLSNRAKSVLSRVERILCEDTRKTRSLLAAYGCEGRLERLDAHTEAQKIPEVLRRIEAGGEIALVSDAGTPAVSDPGARLVAAAREAGIRVCPVPGPSAVTALMSVGGFRELSFAFRGFFPRKEGERRDEIRAALSDARIGVTLWFESPERIQEVLESLASWEEMKEVRVVVAKEMTKAHEDYLQGSAEEVLEKFRAYLSQDERYSHGEWCLAVERGSPARVSTGGGDAWKIALRLLLDVKVPASEAAKRVSESFKVSKRMVYETALKFSGKK